MIFDILTLMHSEVVHTGLLFFPPPPAAVTVGKQYATPRLPSSKGVCFCASTVPRYVSLNLIPKPTLK